MKHKVLGLVHFGSCQNCLSSVNLVAEIHWKLWNKRALSKGEPCTCEYVTLLQSFVCLFLCYSGNLECQIDIFSGLMFTTTGG